MRIEDEINEMKRNPTYMRLRRNLNYLENRRFGSTVVSIESPEDFDKVLRVRYRSMEMRDTISEYKKRQTKFDVQMNELYGRKKKLQEQLFKVGA
jgi:hypothetical protein